MISMKSLVYFNPGPRNDCFEGARLRKNIKGALELNGVSWVESLFALPDILHVISPEDENKVHDAKMDGMKVVVSALYSESDPFARYYTKDLDGYYVLKNKAQRTLEAADLILVPSLSAQKSLLASGIKNPAIKVLTPGVNLTRFEKSDPIETAVVYRYLRFGENEKFVISVGDYGDNAIIESFLSVAKMVPMVRFFFVGLSHHGKASEFTLKKLNKEAPKNVKFLDLLEDDVYRSAMMNASIYLCFEGAYPDPMLALEAMASHCQIMFLGHALNDETFEEKKNCYSYKDPEKLAKGIESYCSGKLTPTIIEGYRQAKSASLSLLGKQLKADYESLLKDSEE